MTAGRERAVLAGLAFAVALVTAIGIPAHASYGARVTADEPQYLLSAISLGRDLDLDIGNQLAEEVYRPFHEVDIDPQTHRLDDAGRQVSPHDPLLPALLALPMRLGGWAAAKATLALVAGVLAAATAWLAIHRFAVRRGVAVAVVAAFSCTAPLATYATQVYPEVPAALAVVLALGAATGPLGRRGLVTVSLSVTALPWLSVKYVPVAAVVAGLALWRLRHRRGDVVRLGLALGGAAVVYVVAHRVIYGGWTAYATGDHFAEAGELSVVGGSPDYPGRSRRLIGLLVDRSFGLAAWMPGWLLVPAAVVALLRRRPAGGGALLATALVGWLVATFVALTMHGWWWPGRQVVVVLPLLVVAVAWLADHAGVARGVVGATAAVGVATWCWSTFEAITRRRVLVVDFDRTANPWYRLWRHALPDGRTATGHDAVLTAVWLVLVAGVAWWGWRTAAEERRPSGHPV